MKKAVLFHLCLAMFQISIAQEQYKNTLIDRLSGLKQEPITYFNLGNYSVFTQTFVKEFNAKNILSIGRKYSIRKSDVQYTSKSLQKEHTIIRKNEDPIDGMPRYSTYYFVKKNETEIAVIGFYSVDYNDSLIEQEFTTLYIQDKIPLSIYSSQSDNYAEFAGRKIEKYNSCNWMNVNSLQCPYRGQMNWALHENLSEAQKSIGTQFQITHSQNMISVVSDETIDVIFENKAAKARKVKVKVKVPKLINGGSNELIVYYIAEEIRGRFVSCILSHYTDEKLTKDGVPALLSQVLQIEKQ